MASAVDHADDIKQVESAVDHADVRKQIERPSVEAASTLTVSRRGRRRPQLRIRRAWETVQEAERGSKKHHVRLQNLYRSARYRYRQIWITVNPYTLARDITSTKLPRTRSRLTWTWWQHSYTKIASFYATYRKRRPGERPPVPLLTPRAFERVEAVLDKLDSGHTVITAEDLDCEGIRNIWRYRWGQVALWLLSYEPKRMTQFLLATNSQPGLQSYHFEDSLLQLARCFKYSREKTRMQEVAEAFCTMVEEQPERQLVFMNEFVTLLMRSCSDEQMRRLYDTVSTHKAKLHAYTWLHFTTYFARNNQFETALDCLLKAHKNGADMDGYAFRSNCTTILRRSSEQPDGLRVCLRAVSTLVDIGVKFNLPICNVIMLNAVEAGDLKTAFSVYHSLMERGLKPDEATFLVLLKGCRMNIDDAQLLDEIIRDAISNINVRQNEKVATEILYCLALHHSKHHPANALNTIAEAYAQLFDLTPLQKLDLPISPTLLSKPPSKTPMQPTRHALTFLISATINHHLTTATTPTSNTPKILALYTRWRSHVETATDPLLASLATTDHLANTFLSAFTRHERTLLFAARVVRDMQRPLPPTSPPGIVQIRPTVQTWSIFLLGFTRHRQMKLAEQVLTYMRKQGVEPNQVTWNTLSAGYAGCQDVEGVGGSLRRAEREGMVWNHWTRRGLRFLRGREGLEAEMARRRVAESLDFSGELKEGLGGRLAEAPREEALAIEERRVEQEGFGDSAGEIAEQGVEDGHGGAYRPFR